MNATKPIARLLLTGFGAFESVDRNPSGALARALHDEEGLFGVELPVSFRGSVDALDHALRGLGSRRPDTILCMGVHPGTSFRLERRARTRLRPDRTDVDGETASTAIGEIGKFSGGLATAFDLDALGAVLRKAGASEVEISTDAGGYVCERLYHHALLRGGALRAPSLFLHVPPIAAVPLDLQLVVVRALVGALREGVVTTGRRPAPIPRRAARPHVA